MGLPKINVIIDQMPILPFLSSFTGTKIIDLTGNLASVLAPEPVMEKELVKAMDNVKQSRLLYLKVEVLVSWE
jgi:hypothetical protein